MDTEKKYYTIEEITKEYHELTYKEKCFILYDALVLMEGFNGRSRFKCISIAMGYENLEGELGTFFKRSNQAE